MSAFNPLFVFAADLHLQPCAWARRPELKLDAYYSFQQIVDYCIAEGMNLVLGGDIFDKKRPDPYSVQLFGRQAARLFEHDLAISFVQGDHDHTQDTPWPQVPGFAVHLHNAPCLAGEFPLVGLDWQRRDKLGEALRALPAAHILVAHQGWEELQGIGHTEGSIADIPHISVLLTGDYHVCVEKTVTASDGRSIQVFSPGSTCMQSIDESADKWFLVVGARDGRIECRREPLCTRRKFSLEHHSEESLLRELRDDRILDQFADDPSLAALPDGLRKPILRATFAEDIPSALSIITDAAADRFHIFPNPIASLQTEEVDFATGEDAGVFDTLESVCMELAARPEDYQLAATLLAADDPAAVLEQMFNSYIRADAEAT